MKNIHVIQTDKPSRLAILGMSNTLQLFDKPITFKTFGISPQNIDITSDEEIKEGDWVFDNDANQAVEYKYLRVNPNLPNFPYYKKIILTTDQDLIKDGVQAIDDEFLEWFVKNPSCEYVNIEKYCRNGLCDSKSRSKRDKNDKNVIRLNMDEHRHEDPKDKCWYSGCQCPGERLIIPKEIHLEDIFNDEKKEGIKKLIQKQKLIDMMQQDEQLGLYQETLEESFLANIKNVLQFDNDAQAIRFMEKYFEAKKEQERMYNEEDMRQAFNNGAWRWRMHSKVDIFKEWLNKFKKK
jgi:hypothetical protein